MRTLSAQFFLSLFFLGLLGTQVLASKPSPRFTCDLSRVVDTQYVYVPKYRKIVRSHKNLCKAMVRCENTALIYRGYSRATITGLNQIHSLQKQYGCRAS